MEILSFFFEDGRRFVDDFVLLGFVFSRDDDDMLFGDDVVLF